ncbi:MAG: hypothetical protein V1716_05505 [Candidatus Uhrbacteria bacterium]
MKNPFSMLGGFGTVAMLCIAVSVFYQMNVVGTALFVTLGWFCYGKLALAMFFMQGYGVRRVRTVFGMPLVIVVFVIAIAGIITFLLATTYQPSTLLSGTIANLRAVGWSAASGVATAVGHWYFYARRAYFYQSEYNIRVECGALGDPPEVTEAVVARCRSLGIVR